MYYKLTALKDKINKKQNILNKISIELNQLKELYRVHSLKKDSTQGEIKIITYKLREDLEICVIDIDNSPLNYYTYKELEYFREFIHNYCCEIKQNNIYKDEMFFFEENIFSIFSNLKYNHIFRKEFEELYNRNLILLEIYKFDKSKNFLYRFLKKIL